MKKEELFKMPSEDEMDSIIREHYKRNVDRTLSFTEPKTPLLDDTMKEILRKIYAKMQDNPVISGGKTAGEEMDWWVVIRGDNGSGKSCYAAAMLYEYCKIAGLNFAELIQTNVVYDADDLMLFIAQCDLDKKYQFIWIDEGANVFFNRESISKIRKFIGKFVNQMRDLRYFVVICTVEMSQLDIMIREQRIKSLINIQSDSNTKEARIYHYYNIDGIKELMKRNYGKHNRQWSWGGIHAIHSGWFRYSPEAKELVDRIKRRSHEKTRHDAKYEVYKQILYDQYINPNVYRQFKLREKDFMKGEKPINTRKANNSLHDVVNNLGFWPERDCG